MPKKIEARTGTCAALPLEQQSKPYKAPNMEAGHDGNPPVFVPTRDMLAENGKRERVDGPTNLNHNRLTMLRHRGIIDDVQLKAGEMLYKIWRLSLVTSMASSKLGDMTSTSRGAFQHPNDVKRDAMRRHGDARDVVGRAWPIIEAVCIRDQRIDEAAAWLHIDKRRATGRLEMGLDMLATHYGIKERIARVAVKR